jgi:glutamate synthase domain-containing protein 2
MVRRWFFVLSMVLVFIVLAGAWFRPVVAWSLVVVGPLIALGLYDSFQSSHTILRNFPVIGHARYLLELVRPEIQQYFVESNLEAYPVEREYRSIAYQRAKGELETQPFGTQRDVFKIGYEWASHSIAPMEPLRQEPRIQIGGPACQQPYSASLLNISAMSFGALSSNAILALSRGARKGGFAHNTGEGGVSRYHLEGGGDLIWQIGTGYFGCRTPEGGFDPERFAERAKHPSIRMIELKLSQGAKAGAGGLLPGVKVTEEIARFRGIEPGVTVHSPPGHRMFHTPRGLLEFLQQLRERSGGKPVGFKLCVGRTAEFLSICKAMIETGIQPDFIAVDGGEGGTGAAPLEFAGSMGMPSRDGWIFVHSALQGAGLRDHIRVIVSGKIFTGFHMIRAMALGADACVSARGMMFALGCVQALRCNTDHCPTGITTQNPALVKGLVVSDKAERVYRYHAGTIRGCLDMLGAMGLSHPNEVGPEHIFRRVDDLRVRHFGELYDYLKPGQLLDGSLVPAAIKAAWEAAAVDHWPQHTEIGSHGGEAFREDGREKGMGRAKGTEAAVRQLPDRV